MTLKKEKIIYFIPLLIMLLRGTFYQICRFQFRGLLLLDSGARVLGLEKVKLNGVAKLGRYSNLDARFSKGIELGDRFSLGDFSIMRASGAYNFESKGITIGKNVSFGPYCNIGGGYGLKVGDDCIFGPYVSIHPEEHNFSNFDKPIRSQGLKGAGITIKNNNWFGAKSTILDNVSIGSGCVIGAHTLLTKGVYVDNQIYVGVPAYKLKVRDSK
jgi:acetyltransferase-like isoleucine patch superfamily enzyme